MKEHKVNLKQVDMLCSRCVLNVAKALSRVDGISEFDVNLKDKEIKVTYDNENFSHQNIHDIVIESITKGKVNEEIFHK